MELSQHPASPTWAEIHHQPETWLTTLAIVAGHPATDAIREVQRGAILSGAGSSAYAASAVEQAWPGARAIPTTDLITEAADRFPDARSMVSFARSGNSPESVAAVDRVHALHPAVQHFAITCNSEGSLAQHSAVTPIVLDPRTNDRALAMTSSFSNLVLAGLCISHQAELSEALPALCDKVTANLSTLADHAAHVALTPRKRVVVLAGPPLFPCAREAALKIVELTAGRISVLAETFLGLRHGPMSFVDPDTLVLSFLSSDEKIRRYERDLLAELRAKNIGRLVGVVPEGCEAGIVDEAVPAMAGSLPDHLRTPFEIVYGQLLAFHLSRSAGIDPDNPSPAGVISRVVQGVAIYA